MKKKNIVIGLIMLLLIPSLSIISTVDAGEVEQGYFNAELGRKGNEIPFVILDGSYQVRSRFFTVKGTAETEKHSGRFKGVFKDNFFILKTSLRGITIIGKYRFDSEYQDFTGIWIGRGTPFRGWITGTFVPN